VGKLFHLAEIFAISRYMENLQKKKKSFIL